MTDEPTIGADHEPANLPDAPSAPPPRAARVRRVALNVARVIAGLVVGLALAELAFWWRDAGAFPHLNVYRPDSELGVALRPGARQKIVFGGAPVTSVRINQQGFRGADWPAPEPVETLVIGDSQVFGLGVEESETFSARLSDLLGASARVRNAGVPTYGPVEYNLVLERLLRERKPARVIWVVNFYNDLFESERPNTERHAVWDGWAVRHETRPHAIWPFPGRELVYRDSHLFFAVRQAVWGRRAGTGLGLPSEGTFADVLSTSAEVAERRSAAARLERRFVELSEHERQHVSDALTAAQQLTERLAEYYLPSALLYGGYTDGVTLASVRSTPGDIVDYGGGGEFALPGPVTAAQIRLAARMRKHAVEELEKRARTALAAAPAADGMTPASAKDVLAAISRERDVQARASAPEARSVAIIRGMLPISGAIERAKALTDAAGAELVVVALPMDVQVSDTEWAKYGAEPVPMDDALVLVEDVVATARALGARAVDVTPALRASEPGAFLPGDLHLTPAGHEVVARAIVAELESRPVARPVGGLPVGRSRAPDVTEWDSIGETLVFGSSARSCVTKRLREYIGVFCGSSDATPDGPFGATVVAGGRGEVALSRYASKRRHFDWIPAEGRYGEIETDEVVHSVNLVAPVLPGDRLEVDYYWVGRGVSRLTIVFAPDGDDTVEFGRFRKGETLPELPVTDAAKRLCDCFRELAGASSCGALPAAPDPNCSATYTTCRDLLACASGDARTPPTCPEGFANGTPRERCFPTCDAAHPCATGTCSVWQGGGLCLPTDPGSSAAPPTEWLPGSALEPSPEALRLITAVLDAGATATRSCELVGAQDDYRVDVHDRCPSDAATWRPYAEAVAALAAHVEAHPADGRGPVGLLLEQAMILDEWARLLVDGAYPRGALPRYAALAESWNAWRPTMARPVYTEQVLTVYREGARTKASAQLEPNRLSWKRCRGGPCL